MTMIMVNIYEVKAKLSEYVEAATRGERVLICRRNRPVAELRAIVSAPDTPRPIGGAKGRLTVPASFFEPLPDEILAAFEASGEPGGRVARVAEGPNPYGARRRGRRSGRR